MELLHRIRKDFRFNKGEVKEIIIASLILGVTFALRSWADATLGDFILGTIIALTSILFHVSTQKIVGLKIGFSAYFKMSWIGLGISVLLTLLYNGFFWWVILPGGTVFSMLPKYRLGKMRYGLNYFPLGLVAFSGAIGSIVYGTIFKNIELYLSFIPIDPSILHAFFLFNLAYAAISLLPIPPFDGHYLLFGSRNWYVFLAILVLTYTVLAVFGLYSWIIAIVIGLIGWISYYVKVERKL